MIIDERSYAIASAHVGAYLDLYAAEGMAIQAGHLGRLIGWFKPTWFSPLGGIRP